MRESVRDGAALYYLHRPRKKLETFKYLIIKTFYVLHQTKPTPPAELPSHEQTGTMNLKHNMT